MTKQQTIDLFAKEFPEKDPIVKKMQEKEYSAAIIIGNKVFVNVGMGGHAGIIYPKSDVQESEGKSNLTSGWVKKVNGNAKFFTRNESGEMEMQPSLLKRGAKIIGTPSTSQRMEHISKLAEMTPSDITFRIFKNTAELPEWLKAKHRISNDDTTSRCSCYPLRMDPALR